MSSDPGNETPQNRVQTPATKKARQWHRISIGTLIAVVVVFLVGTLAFDPSQTALRILYAALTAATLFFMWATMNVMIHLRG